MWQIIAPKATYYGLRVDGLVVPVSHVLGTNSDTYRREIRTVTLFILYDYIVLYSHVQFLSSSIATHGLLD